jgi:hypothetical protein
MPDRNIVSYLAVSQGEFEAEEMISFFEQAGYSLEYPGSADVRGFSSQGEPITHTRRGIFEAVASDPYVGVSLWKDDSNDIFCTIRFKSDCTVLAFDLRGTTPEEQINIFTILGRYFTRLGIDRKLLGFVGDFEDVIESDTDRDRLFLR